MIDEYFAARMVYNKYKLTHKRRFPRSVEVPMSDLEGNKNSFILYR